MLFEYLASRKLSLVANDSINADAFYSLIMAAIREADTTNREKLKAAWPEVYAEFWKRVDAPGGVLNCAEAKLIA